jgi:hypothetical protein
MPRRLEGALITLASDPYWPPFAQVNVFHEIFVERSFFMKYDGYSTRTSFCEGNSRVEKVFQEFSGERAIFRGGECFS